MSNSDILIIGAGYTGAMIAAKLAELGAQVSVVDALHVASGATQRALGLAMPCLDPRHAKDTVHSLQVLLHTATQHGVMPHGCRVLHLGSTPSRADALRNLWLSLAETEVQGLFKWETSPMVVPQGFGGGLLVDGCATLDVGMLTTKLLQHRGIAVHTGIQINKIEHVAGQNIMLALADGYTIRSQVVVLATNAYSGLLSPYLADALQFVRGVVWTSRIINFKDDNREDDQDMPQNPLVIDEGRMVVVPGADDRVRIGAWHWDASPHTVSPADDVQKFVGQYLSALQTELWQSTVTTLGADGVHGLPMTGRLDSASGGRTFYALGLGPYGLAWGPIVADRVASLIGA
jgi:glycine/D-amino acid oxidase-like deaminating enzyme